MPTQKPKSKPEKLLPEGLARALVDRPSGMDSRELLNELTRCWGGTGKLALDIRQEFKNSPPGGMVRQRILEMLQRLIINNTEHELTNVVRPSEMSNEDLERTLKKYIDRMAPDA